jgi:hypothetical protein
MNKFKPYLIIAAVAIVTGIVVRLVIKPMLPVSIAQYL